MPEAITSYADTGVERTELIGDTLWRCVPAPRGGRRGHSQKLRHLQEGMHKGFIRTDILLFFLADTPTLREWGQTESEEEGAGSSSVLEPPARKAKPAPPIGPVFTTQVISVPSKATVETSQVVLLPVQAKPKVRLATTSKGVPQSRATDLGNEREVTDLQSKAAS